MKIKIYVDFEAITFNYLASLNFMYFKELGEQKIDLPYCYTIGFIDQNKKLNTLSNVFDLTPIAKIKPLKQFWNKAQAQFLGDLKKLLKNDKLNLNQLKFYSWNNSLESKLLQKFFNLESIDLAQGRSISLDKLVPNNLFVNDDFSFLFEQQINYLSKKIKFLPEDSKGKIAACLGALIIASLNSFYTRNTKLKTPLAKQQIKQILKQVLLYNKNDVLKLHYVDQNISKTNTIINEITMLNKQKSKVMNEINRINSWITYFEILKTNYKIPGTLKLQNLMQLLNNKIQELEANTQKLTQNEKQYKLYNKLLLILVNKGALDLYLKSLDTSLNSLKKILEDNLALKQEKLEKIKLKSNNTLKKYV